MRKDGMTREERLTLENKLLDMTMGIVMNIGFGTIIAILLYMVIRGLSS